MRIDVKFIAVRGAAGSRAHAREDLQSFLYDHTKIVEFDTDGKEFFALLRTESQLGDENATYLANYQAGRLRSGLMSATVGDTAVELPNGVR